MIIELIKRLFNLFIDIDKEYVDIKVREHHNLFLNNGEKPLNRKQCEAIVKNKRYNQVIAAAGTGKTTVLSYRIKYLIEEGIEPTRIIAITYSRKAADEMERRLRKQFSITDVEVRTIHSFAYKIIRNETIKKIQLVTIDEIRNIIKMIFNKLLEKDSAFYENYFQFLRYYNNLSGEETNIEIEKGNIIEDFINFIDLAKKNDISPGDIKKLLDRTNREQYYFGLCARSIYQNYQIYLRNTSKIDFNDMLILAVEILNKNPEKYFTEYDHMLIDEFQDVSYRQIEFIRLFFQKESRMKLFCVGDDWQSIYSFQGSETEYFMKFEKYFGKAAKTYLIDNYRCPQIIIEAGNLLMSKNKAQIKKKVKGYNLSASKPLLYLLENGPYYEDYLSRYTLTLIRKMLREGCKPSDIMVLCRFDEAVPYLDKVRKLLKKEGIPYVGKGNNYYNPLDFRKPENAVSVFSIHQAKGCEADNVILLHVVAEGPHSFPEPERESNLLEPVKINKIDHIQEERRLFYVAISRTAEQLHILTQKHNISPFIKEIDPYLIKKGIIKSAEIDDYISFTGVVYTIWKKHSEKIKQVGLLEDREGNRMKFLSWRSSKAPVLKENSWYELKNVKISSYQNKPELLLTDLTEAILIYK